MRLPLLMENVSNFTVIELRLYCSFWVIIYYNAVLYNKNVPFFATQGSWNHFEMEVQNQAAAMERQQWRGTNQVCVFLTFSVP